MDTTFPGNQAMWRAIEAPFLHHAGYWINILAEAAVAALCWLGGIQLIITMNDASRFNQDRRVAIAGLALEILLLYLIQPADA